MDFKTQFSGLFQYFNGDYVKKLLYRQIAQLIWRWGNVPVMDFCMTGDKHHTLFYVIEILALFHRVVFGHQAADLQGFGIQKVRNSKTGF